MKHCVFQNLFSFVLLIFYFFNDPGWKFYPYGSNHPFRSLLDVLALTEARGRLPGQLYSRTLKSEFCTIFMCHGIVF